MYKCPNCTYETEKKRAFSMHMFSKHKTTMNFKEIDKFDNEIKPVVKTEEKGKLGDINEIAESLLVEKERNIRVTNQKIQYLQNMNRNHNGILNYIFNKFFK